MEDDSTTKVGNAVVPIVLLNSNKCKLDKLASISVYLHVYILSNKSGILT